MPFDTHTHAWGPPSEDHPWVNEAVIEHSLSGGSVDIVYTAEKLLADMDDTGIDEAVLVGYPITEWTDNWYAKHAVEEFDRLKAIVMVDPFAPDASDRLRELMDVDGILGVRLGASFPADGMWTTFDASSTRLRQSLGQEGFWDAVEETDALVQLLIHAVQLDQLREVVEAHPDVRYVIDHFAYLAPGETPDETVQSDLATLSEFDTVAMKVSSAPEVSNQAHPYDDLHDHVRWFLDLFGRERVMWGSDFPNVSSDATYREALTWLDHVDGLSARDREWMTERSFREFVGLA